MTKEFEVRWEGDLPASPAQVWDAVTKHSGGWLWPIGYEPRAGGAERGLTSEGGKVTAWEPSRHFATRAGRDDVETGFNELDYVLEPRAAGTYLDYRHRAAIDEETFDLQLDSCRHHTEFYYHSLGQYLRHFAGPEAAYIAAKAPEASAVGGFATVREALGVPDNADVGDRVRLTPDGLEPIDAVVDYATPAFLGFRSTDGLHRVYGRDFWGRPVSVTHHLFGGTIREEAWSGWLDGIFVTEELA